MKVKYYTNKNGFTDSTAYLKSDGKKAFIFHKSGRESAYNPETINTFVKSGDWVEIPKSKAVKMMVKFKLESFKRVCMSCGMSNVQTRKIIKSIQRILTQTKP